jgi:hypothetical protein
MSMNECQIIQNTAVDKSANFKIWMYETRNKYKELLAEQEDIYSPGSSRINSKRIWLNDLCQMPLLERQRAFNKERYLTRE